MKLGDKAPEFALKDRTGKKYSLKDFKSDYLIVYFYPKDDTPGCTLEAKGFTKSLPSFKKLKTEVIGISGGDEASKAKFCKKYGLKHLLLSDPAFTTTKKYGSWGEKTFMGRKTTGILRNTYLLDKNRKVVKIFEKVVPEAHPEEIIEAITYFGKKGGETISLGKKLTTKVVKRVAAPKKRTAPKTATKAAKPTTRTLKKKTTTTTKKTAQKRKTAASRKKTTTW